MIKQIYQEWKERRKARIEECRNWMPEPYRITPEELEKINRIIDREWPAAHKQSMLVLDATTGQNAINQAKEFQEVADVDGIILTKLDGTAKGGVVLSISQMLGVPVRYVGVGEGIDDLQAFDPKDFARLLLDSDLDLEQFEHEVREDQ